MAAPGRAARSHPGLETSHPVGIQRFGLPGVDLTLHFGDAPLELGRVFRIAERSIPLLFLRLLGQIASVLEQRLGLVRWERIDQARRFLGEWAHGTILTFP